jgi:phosphoribosyl 1,2-cyclic phosphate phosphodiesterase
LINHQPFGLLGATVIPVHLRHGPRFNVLGFRIGNVAYCTDVSEIPHDSWPLLENLDTLVLDALRPEQHATHLSLDEAIEIARRLAPRQTYFTHCACQIDYEQTNARLPPGIQIGYDGLQIELV